MNRASHASPGFVHLHRLGLGFGLGLGLGTLLLLGACSNKAEAPADGAAPPTSSMPAPPTPVASAPGPQAASVPWGDLEKHPPGFGAPPGDAGGGAGAPPPPPPPPTRRPAAVEPPADDARLEPCPVTQSALSPADCQAAQRAMADARPGSAAIDAPARMRQGQTTEVTLVMQAASTAAAQQAVTEAASAAAGTATQRTVGRFAPRVGARMQVELTGEGFEFKPQSDTAQLVSADTTTSWHWSVTAKSPGKHRLIFTTTVSFQDSQGHEVKLKQSTDYHEIEVAVGFDSLSEWLKDTKVLIGLVTAVVTALAGLFAAWRKLKGSPARKPGKPRKP